MEYRTGDILSGVFCSVSLCLFYVILLLGKPSLITICQVRKTHFKIKVIILFDPKMYDGAMRSQDFKKDETNMDPSDVICMRVVVCMCSLTQFVHTNYLSGSFSQDYNKSNSTKINGIHETHVIIF